MLNNNSLEKYHVLECGYSIKCKPYFPEVLYEVLEDNKSDVIVSPFKSYIVYLRRVLLSLSSVSAAK